MYYVQSVAVRLAVIENTSTETSWGIVLGLKEDSFIRQCFPFGNANLISSVYYLKSGHRELSSFSGAVLIWSARLGVFQAFHQLARICKSSALTPLPCYEGQMEILLLSHIWPALPLHWHSHVTGVTTPSSFATIFSACTFSTVPASLPCQLEIVFSVRFLSLDTKPLKETVQ